MFARIAFCLFSEQHNKCFLLISFSEKSCFCVCRFAAGFLLLIVLKSLWGFIPCERTGGQLVRFSRLEPDSDSDNTMVDGISNIAY